MRRIVGKLFVSGSRVGGLEEESNKTFLGFWLYFCVKWKPFRRF